MKSIFWSVWWHALKYHSYHYYDIIRPYPDAHLLENGTRTFLFSNMPTLIYLIKPRMRHRNRMGLYVTASSFFATY